MPFLIPVFLALAGGLLGGFILWHIVGNVGLLAANHPSGALTVPLVLLTTFAGTAAWRMWRRQAR